jgi:hypothetical protein
MRVNKSHVERLRRVLAASVVALLAAAPALAAETAQPAAARYVPTLEDYMGVYAALQKYRDGVEKHDDALQRSAFWEDSRRGGGRAGPPPGGAAGAPPGAGAGPPPGGAAGARGPNAGPPGGANARRPTWEEIKAMPGFVEVWHLPLDSYIHFESATRATHYEYYLSIYPQPEKKGEGISNMQARTSIAGWPGHYDDVLEKRNGEWRILQRQMRMNEK